MKPPYPSLTSEWHNDTYPAISPTNPSLSVTGKTIVVTGGGSGIGRETARAYAEAGAAHVAIMGRTQSTLSETKEIIGTEYPKTDVTTHVADITDECAVGEAARSIGAWDVLILNAAKILAPNSIDKTSLGEWWSVCEVSFPILSDIVSICTLHFSPASFYFASCTRVTDQMLRLTNPTDKCQRLRRRSPSIPPLS